MHGIEEDFCVELEEKMDGQEYECCCGNYCFDCLGMSWRDFM
jgi:hypothetical protein